MYRLQVILAKHLPLVAIRGCSVDPDENVKNSGKHGADTAKSTGTDDDAPEEALSPGQLRRMTSLVYFDSPTFDVFTAVVSPTESSESIWQ